MFLKDILAMGSQVGTTVPRLSLGNTLREPRPDPHHHIAPHCHSHIIPVILAIIIRSRTLSEL